jgi:hypothetical protein
MSGELLVLILLLLLVFVIGVGIGVSLDNVRKSAKRDSAKTQALLAEIRDKLGK